MEQVGSKSERPKRALIPKPATLRPASFDIRTADSDVNGFLRFLLNRIHLKALASVKKNLTCEFVWISFLTIKRERFNGRSQ